MKPRPLYKHILAVAAFALVSLTAGAVFREKDLAQTLRILHYELRNTYAALVQKSAATDGRDDESQHEHLVKLMEDCNELSLMLYSQGQDFTFDLTYALNEATEQYEDFQATKMPYEEIIQRLEVDVDRYKRLIAALKKLPPRIEDGEDDPLEPVVAESDSIDDVKALADSLRALLGLDTKREERNSVSSSSALFQMDSSAVADRDSCLSLSRKILLMHQEMLAKIKLDNSDYEETDSHLKVAYDYAQSRYRSVQKKVFTESQGAFTKTLGNLRGAWHRAVTDCIDKYSTNENGWKVTSEWRGPVVNSFIFAFIFFIIFATFLANIVVKLCMRWFKWFQGDYFREHRTMFTLLLGVVIFALAIMIGGMSISHRFVRMSIRMLAEFAWLLAAVFASILIRQRGNGAKMTLWGYAPIILTGLVIVIFRTLFLPNSMLNILFPPILLVFSIWQAVIIYRSSDVVAKSDLVYMCISMGVLAVATVMSWMGYVMLALVVVIWWTFQLTVLQTVTAVYHLLNLYHERKIKTAMESYKKKNPFLDFKKDGAYIELTWLYDLLKMTVIPIFAICSLPMCLGMAGNVFDLQSVIKEFFYKPLVTIDNVIHLSLFKVVLVSSLYFVFKYLAYALKAFNRVWRTRSKARKSGNRRLRETDLNFNLINNIISLLCWGLYIIIAFLILKIPTSAITIVSTGLATGIGFAMKDVLNNFFYGVQLMSGRLRVGDVIECGGIRGTVESMSYQSTQIVATDGSIMAFPNASLFSQNFKNLTRNHSYELMKIPVGVKYGTDVEKVRELIIEAITDLQAEDNWGRNLIDRSRGIDVRFSDFGDNSVNLEVVLFTTVESHYTFAAKAKEAIYNVLNENNIEIPFPQRDVYIKQAPSLDGTVQEDKSSK